SLNLSLSAPWICEIIWESLIEQILVLTKIVDQYANFLKKTNERMHEIHYNSAPARDPSINLKVYTIDVSSDNIKEVYKELSNVLSFKDEYDFINMKHYLPKD
ncbi:9054_t:CDS:1, partial [Funneliformis caledonium]